jgi:hypothetical protein
MPEKRRMKMESFIPIYRLLHFIGFALLLGGTFASVILVHKEHQQIFANRAKAAWICMHLVAAPGLTLLLLTGLLQSSALYWQNFKGAGYMHLKVGAALTILLLMVFDMRTQKKIICAKPQDEVLVTMVKKRQVYAIGICALTLLIMWLVSFRPF